MLLAEYRGHDGADQFRVWTQEDAAYGSFKLVDRAQLKTIIAAFHLMDGCCRPAEDAHIDPVDVGLLRPCTFCRTK